MARRKMSLSGLAEMDLGTPVRNVMLGAGVSLAGEILVPRIPIDFVQNIAYRFPGGAGALATAAASVYAYYRSGTRVAKEIAIGGAILAAGPLIQGLLREVLGMGLVTAHPSYGAVVPEAVMSDGSRSALGADDYGPQVLQGAGGLGMNNPVNILQGQGASIW